MNIESFGLERVIFYGMKTFCLIASLAVAVAAAAGMLGYIDVSPLFGNNADLKLKVLFPAFFVSLITSGVLFIAIVNKQKITRGYGKMTRRHAPPAYETVAAKIDEIESEMKRIGMWQSNPLDPGQYNFTRAFAMDTMAFSQWLQFIFIPRVKEIISNRGAFPPYSQVGAQAVREFDGYAEADTLCSLLGEFDRLFDPNLFSVFDPPRY